MDFDLDIGEGLPEQSIAYDLPEVDIPEYPPMKDGEKAKNFNTIIIDTINELQDIEYLDNMSKQGKANFQNYIDLNVKLKVMMNEIKSLFDELVIVIGAEGTGKSFGVKTLDPRHTLWINVDGKLPTFRGGRNNYSKARGNMVTEIKDYRKISGTLKWAKTNSSRTEPVIVFLLGHMKIDTESGGRKLKLIGRFGESLNIVGAVTNCYYTHIVPADNGKTQFLMDTENDGFNNARSLEGLFPTRFIPNNFEYVRQQIINY